MNKLLVLAATALLFTLTHAHLTQICSSTNPAKAGEIDFYFGTYHSAQSNTPPGTVTISQPGVAGGAKLSGSFTKRYTATNNKHNIGTPADMKKELIKITGGAVTDKCLVECYVVNKQSSAMKAPPSGQWIVPNPQTSKADMTCAGGSYTYSRFFSRLTIKGAKSGDWKLEIKGTDQVYDPGAKQCSLSTKNPKWIGGMQVADGTPPCKGAPPVPASIDAASVKSCHDMIGGAQCNNFKCNANMKDGVLKGHIKCEKGKWDVTATCQGKSKCAQEANSEISTITSTVAACQATVNGMSDGAHCVNELKKEVDAATTKAANAAAAAKGADADVGKAKSTNVKFNALPLDQLSGLSCAQLMTKLKANSNHGSAKSAWDAAEKAKVQADANKKAADTTLANLKKDQATAVLKCQCNAQNKHDAAFDKCTMNKKAEKIAWDKSHHLKCVQNGEVTLNAGSSSGKCAVPPVPTVKDKKMAFKYDEKKCMGVGLEEYEDDIAEMDVDTEQVEVESAPKMPGWHMMPDGEMMRDTDMY